MQKFKPVLCKVKNTRLRGWGGSLQMFIHQMNWKSSGSLYFTKKEQAKASYF